MKFSRASALQQILFGERWENFFLFLLILIPNTVAAFLEGISFTFILLALKALTPSSENLVIPLLSKWFSSLTLIYSFTVFLLIAVALQILRSSLNYVGQVATTYFGTRIQRQIQQKIYTQILSLSFSCVHRYDIGNLLENAKMAGILPTMIMDAMNRMFISILGIAASLVIMFFLSSHLTLFALSTFCLLGISQKFIFKYLSRISRTLSDASMDLSKQAVQSLNGIRTIHTFHQQKRVLDKILYSLQQIIKSSRKLNLWNHAIGPINEIMGIVVVGIFLIVGQYLIQGEKTAILPILLTFVTIAYRMNSRMQVLMTAGGSIAGNWGQLLKLEEILSPQGKEFTPTQGKPFIDFHKAISFQGLTLQYPGREEHAIKKITLSLPKGKTAAFVGSSGAGKSSIVDLLLRLYDPTEGSIQIDGVDLKNYEIGIWREKLGVVSQDVFIFNQTIEENIRFGAPDAPFEKICEASHLAGAHRFISALSQNYQTVVGENGHRLSGGEKQRLALARVLVRDPAILVLDEATSNLDSESEQLIQQSIKLFQGQKTLLIVAHRLSTIQHADQIFVLEKGEIIESGTHSTLLTQQGRYALFWDMQSKGERIFL